MTTYKAAIIGCGSITEHRHLPEYEQHEDVEIVALCDINKARAEKMQKIYGGRVYTDYEELLKEEAIDLVSICLPNALHAPASIAALKSGAHVLCEKPMAASSEEASQMIEAADEANRKLMIAHNQRFVSSHQKAKALIEEGALGKVYSFRTTFGHGGPEGWSADGKDSWFFKKDEAIIGAMGDLGVHKADLMRYLLGEEFTEVSAMVETNCKDNCSVDDNAVCLLKSESGVIGTLTASWSFLAHEDNSTVIYGEKGVIRLEDDPTYSLIVMYADGTNVNYELGKIQSNEEGSQTSTDVINHFVEAVQLDQTPSIDGREAKRSLDVIFAAMKSGDTGERIKL